ncbi:conserved unknown protein [Nannochloropsis gaditana]|uniref:Uncharacterized protein n=1 Tax=Nannochloropsis gaditana TaxID=72520 RepID=W7TN25_9STRA|nr:conserved unknown protein [Nannochloropsis gaditana]
MHVLQVVRIVCGGCCRRSSPSYERGEGSTKFWSPLYEAASVSELSGHYTNKPFIFIKAVTGVSRPQQDTLEVMGAYASTRLLTPDEAAGLLGPELSQRVEEGFSRLSVNGNDGGRGDGIDQRTFHRHVLEAFPAMPVVVVRTLFDAIDATAGGRREGGRGQGLVAMDDFMCMAAVLLKGSAEQRMRLAFRVYEVMGLRRLEGGGGRVGGRGGGGDFLFRGQVSSALSGNQGNPMGLGGGGRAAEGRRLPQAWWPWS